MQRMVRVEVGSVTLDQLTAADEYLSPPQVCAEYPVFGTPSALAERRWRGEGPDYIKMSKSRSGRVFYKRSAIEQWLDDCTVMRPAEAAR
jgi:hypothetical protein